MRETSKFTIHRHKTPSPHYDLVLEGGGERRHWIIPTNIPKEFREKRIAIEQGGIDGLQNESEIAKTVEDAYGKGESEVWDKGSFELKTAKSVKLVIKAKGGKFRGNFLLFVPGWGKWTKKRIWVLEKVKNK